MNCEWYQRDNSDYFKEEYKHKDVGKLVIDKLSGRIGHIKKVAHNGKYKVIFNKINGLEEFEMLEPWEFEIIN